MKQAIVTKTVLQSKKSFRDLFEGRAREMKLLADTRHNFLAARASLRASPGRRAALKNRSNVPRHLLTSPSSYHLFPAT